jgi:hypothetical protein
MRVKRLLGELREAFPLGRGSMDFHFGNPVKHKELADVLFIGDGTSAGIDPLLF